MSKCFYCKNDIKKKVKKQEKTAEIKMWEEKILEKFKQAEFTPEEYRMALRLSLAIIFNARGYIKNVLDSKSCSM